MANERQHADILAPGQALFGKARLANPRLAPDQQDTAPAGPGVFQASRNHVLLILAADQGCECGTGDLQSGDIEISAFVNGFRPGFWRWRPHGSCFLGFRISAQCGQQRCER